MGTTLSHCQPRPTTALWACLLTAALLSGSLASAPCARAQDADEQQVATARLLFKRGVEQADAGDWEAAVDSFERALALRESTVIRFNLAHALQQTGRLVEASENFRAVQSDPDLAAGATAALEEIEPRLATLTVTVSDAPEEADVRLDGTVLLPAQIGVPVPSDPGAHEATLELQGKTLAEERVTLEEGGDGTIALVYVPTPAEAAATVVEPEPAPAPVERDDTSRRRKRWIIGVSAAVAVVAAAVIVGVTASGGGGSSSPTLDHNPFDPGEITVRGQ